MSSSKDFRSEKSTHPLDTTARGVKYSTDVRPHVSVVEHAEEGAEVFRDYMERVNGGLRVLLATLDGFRRDAVQLKDAESLVSLRMEQMLRPFVTPSITPDMHIEALVQALTRVSALLEGEIVLARMVSDPGERQRVVSDLRAIHSNLGDVSHGAQQLHDHILEAERRFDAWNAENGEEYQLANIHFDRDALNLASALARATGERAIRLDIDVVTLLNTVLDAKKGGS